MEFKYNCFIENTAEAREWLESIGYERYVYTVCPDDYDIITTTEDGFYILFTSKSFEKVDHFMDTPCRGNIELFKALTAVRDDDPELINKIKEIEYSYGVKIRFDR